MKREIAKREIDSLDYYLQNHTNDYSEESHMAMMMAIKALEQESCEGEMTNQEKFIQTFGLITWQAMIVFTGLEEQYKEYWTSPYKESEVD